MGRVAVLTASLLLAACGGGAYGPAQTTYAPSYAPPPPPPATTGGIYQASAYASLVEDNRARRVGDILTIRLVERTQATKTASADTKRDSNYALNLPDVVPASVAADYLSGGVGSSFKGSGGAAQSNALSGEITVTVAQVMPNGAMLVRGEKLVTLNRGDEFVRFSGLVRPEDVSPQNSVLSTRVADARIAYSGRGEIAAQSRQGWLGRFFTALSPF